MTAIINTYNKKLHKYCVFWKINGIYGANYQKYSFFLTTKNSCLAKFKTKEKANKAIIKKKASITQDYIEFYEFVIYEIDSTGYCKNIGKYV